MPKSSLRRTTLFVAVGALASASGAARAQNASTQQSAPVLQAPGSLGLVYAPNLATPSPENGVKLSETAVLHVGVTAEAGIDSNVFYRNSDRVDSPVIRIIPFAQLTNESRTGGPPDGVFYSLTASLLYREYASNNELVRNQRAFNPTVSALAEFGARQSLSFSVFDNFLRSEEPPYGAVDSTITRDFNSANAQLRWTPSGGRLSSTVRYTNTLDLFETESLKYGNSMRNDLMLDLSWKWLPKTALYLNVTQGYLTYLEDGPGGIRKPSSYPLRALVGLRGLVTEKVTLSLGVGYANAFVQGNGANPNGWGNLSASAEAAYRVTLRTLATLGYIHEFRSSLIGNYYDVDAVYASLGYNLASRVVTTLFGRYEYRQFHAAGTALQIDPLANGRKDDVVQAGASMDYFLQRWLFAGVFYVYAADRAHTAFCTAATPGPNCPQVTTGSPVVQGLNYDKHLVLGRVGVTY